MSSAASNKTSLFPETRWSLVLDAQGARDSRSHRALGELCQIYWYPIYLYARRAGLSPQDSEDRTQEFFQRITEEGALGNVAQNRGKLRAYLQAAMRNFLNDRWRHDLAQKRGGAEVHVSIDQEWAEARIAAEPSGDAEDVFDRAWAFSVLRKVFDRLEEYFEQRGKADLYESIRGCLQGDGTYEDTRKVAAKLNISEEGVRSAVFKLRRRFRDYVHDEIRETCRSETEFKEEIAYLCRMLTQRT